MKFPDQAVDKIRVASRVFIERPRLAFVVSIVMSLAGAICINFLPVAEYPRLRPRKSRLPPHILARVRT